MPPSLFSYMHFIKQVDSNIKNKVMQILYHVDFSYLQYNDTKSNN